MEERKEYVFVLFSNVYICTVVIFLGGAVYKSTKPDPKEAKETLPEWYRGKRHGETANFILSRCYEKPNFNNDRSRPGAIRRY